MEDKVVTDHWLPFRSLQQSNSEMKLTEKCCNANVSTN